MSQCMTKDNGWHNIMVTKDNGWHNIMVTKDNGCHNVWQQIMNDNIKKYITKQILDEWQKKRINSIIRWKMIADNKQGQCH